MIDDETWWEVKSWRSISKTNRAPNSNVPIWKFNDDGKSAKPVQVDDSGDDEQTSGKPHKQFSLDRIADKQKAFLTGVERKAKGLDPREPTDPPGVAVDDVFWQFHKFTSGKKKDIVNPTSAKLKSEFEKPPIGGGSAFKAQSSSPKGIISVGGSSQILSILKEKGVDLAKEAAEDAFLEPSD